MPRRHPTVLVALVSLVVAACAGDDAGSGEPTTVPSSPATDAPPADFTEVSTTDASEPTAEEFVDGPLAEVCPDTIVVQLEDAPSVEHGPLYRLLAAAPTVADDGSVTSGTIVRADGRAEDVVLEVRSGGAPVGFRSPIALMAADPSIVLGVTSTARAVERRDELATLSVLALSDRSHQVILWDPAANPGVDDLTSLAATGIEIHHAPGEPFVAYLEATGVLDRATLLDTYLGSPAAFVSADGAIAQQGDALVDPQLLASLPQWDRPVRSGWAADEGWASYDDTLVVRSDDHAELDACLDRFVPVLQDAMVAHLAEPTIANRVVVDVRARVNPLTRTTIDLLDRGVAAGQGEGVLGGRVDDTIGAFDTDRLASFLPELADVLGFPDTSPDDVATNDHVVADALR